MRKLNCWEFMKCGREPSGLHVTELGECPAAVEVSTDGINAGRNGGRACWAISGTYCDDKVQGTFASKIGDCKQCSFYKMVHQEEARQFKNTREIRRVYMLRQLANHVGVSNVDILQAFGLAKEIAL
ncbi:MAG: hypothetical protein JRE14_08955 [Deltaproteobacteria bacterium]|nr:hypothetical protein [Deltaproteobacteria bacterium]